MMSKLDTEILIAHLEWLRVKLPRQSTWNHFFGAGLYLQNLMTGRLCKQRLQ
jgi:hypothetical protein